MLEIALRTGNEFYISEAGTIDLPLLLFDLCSVEFVSFSRFVRERFVGTAYVRNSIDCNRYCSRSIIKLRIISIESSD